MLDDLHTALGHLRSPEVLYILLVMGLFVVPRVLQRFRIPAAVSCVGIGAASGMGLGAFQADPTVSLLSILGIVSLFLFAGLEVEFADFRRGAGVILVHLLIQSALLVVATGAVWYYLYLDVRVSVLYALAIVTPSTGFILDSLPSFGLREEQQFWVKSKAIAAELLALGILLVTTQSRSVPKLVISIVVLVAMIVSLPRLFRLFVRRVLPFAPKSEFAFLVIVALACAAITRQLGVYYLVGAFVVGVTARRFGQELPAVASKDLMRSVELFASFFIPFYFFKAGLRLSAQDFGWRSLAIGAILLAVTIPVRVATVVLHRAREFSWRWRVVARLGIALVPTLVFSLVIAHILKDQFALPPALYGALVVYALATTIIPGAILGARQEYDKPSVFPPPQPSADG